MQSPINKIPLPKQGEKQQTTVPNIQFTQNRKYFGEQKPGDMKKSSIFFSNPSSQNTVHFQHNNPPKLEFKPNADTHQVKKLEGNLKLSFLDKKPYNTPTAQSSAFDKMTMHSSQIIASNSTSNFRKGGLEAMGKFVPAHQQIQANEQKPRKDIPPNIVKQNNNEKPFNNLLINYKDNNLNTQKPVHFEQKKNIYQQPVSKYPQSNNKPFNYENQPSTYYNNYNYKPQQPYKPEINTHYKQPQTIKTNIRPTDYISGLIKPNIQDTYKPAQYTSPISSYSTSVSYNPPVGSKEYYLQLSKKTTEQIIQNKKLEQKKQGQIPSFGKKQYHYETTNDYLKQKTEITNFNNQIIVPNSISFVKNKSNVATTAVSISKSTITKEDFQMGKKLGKGQFGDVFVVKHKFTGFICAMKIIKKSVIKQQKVQDQLVRELKIQFFLHHNNIAALYGFFNDADNVYLLLELCSDGQLFDILKKQRRLPEQRVSDIIGQVCNGLEYIHRQRIIHRDIKPQNVIMHLGVAKICDFGWAVYRGDGLRSTFCGTPLYTSPELIRGEQYDEKVDIWAVGILTYELIVGRIPFRILSEGDMNKIVSDDIKFPQFVDVADVSKDFILKILKKNPEDRFQVQELLSHAFLKLKKPSEYTFDILI